LVFQKLYPREQLSYQALFFLSRLEDDLEIGWQKTSFALYGVLAMWCGGRDRQEMPSVQCAELTSLGNLRLSLSLVIFQGKE